MGKTEADQTQPVSTTDTGSQLTARNQSVEIDGATSRTADSATPRPTRPR